MVSKQKTRELNALCQKLGIAFNDTGLWQQALTHTSYANERKGETLRHNERLEFLGDAVLDLVISEYLFRHFSDLPEGDLTKARAAIVCETTLARRAREMDIGQYLLLGKGEASSGGRERISILADAFEAIIGALYLDHGFEAANRFILIHLSEDLDALQRGDYSKDYKTLLQEAVQRNCNNKIIYELVAEKGPDHNKVFEVCVSINENKLGSGSGKSKKEAEQNAARQALGQLNLIND